MRHFLPIILLVLAPLATGCAREAARAADAWAAAKSMEKAASSTFSKSNLQRLKADTRRTARGAEAVFKAGADRTALRVKQLGDMMRSAARNMPKPRVGRPYIRISLRERLLRKAEKNRR